ncbi:MAG: acyltransferase [Kineosporiaceae bacterium]
MSALVEHAPAATPVRARYAYADNLKVVLVIGVIVAHVTMAWTGMSTWVFDEPPIREPLLSLLSAVEVIGGMFGMALFFLIAGAFTPGSLSRKGMRRFLIDRTVRLGVPMAFFMIALSPFVEYADPDNAGWDQGFWRFTVAVWGEFVPGPTWFLGVLLVLSAAYALLRAAHPRAAVSPSPLRARHLVLVGTVVALTSYLVRIGAPIGVEHWHLNVAQAPAWVAGFALGVLGGERGWFEGLSPELSRGLFRAAWAAVAGTALFVGTASATGADIDLFSGGGAWQSFVIAALEGVLMVAMSLWLLDLFRRRANRPSHLGRELGRAAFAAFVVHQVVLVALVLWTHHLPWPPEVEYLFVGALGVAGSFAIASVLVRLPGVSHVV